MFSAMNSSGLSRLESRLDYRFKNRDLIVEALTHSSYKNENRDTVTTDNERLEFLGDTAVGMCVAKMLFETYPAASEGQLSKLKAQLVSEKVLSDICVNLELATLLFLSKGAQLEELDRKASVQADVMEAVLAAIFLDGGWIELQYVVARMYQPYLAGIKVINGSYAIANAFDYKSHLQELFQKAYFPVPKYQLIAQSDCGELLEFEMGIFCDNVLLSSAKGTKKKLATQQAAKNLLELYKSSQDLIAMLNNKGLKPMELSS